MPKRAPVRALSSAALAALAALAVVATTAPQAADAAPTPTNAGATSAPVVNGGGHMQAGASGGTTPHAATPNTGSSTNGAMPAATTAASSPSGYPVKGIDIASFQEDPNCSTPINWSQVAGAGYTFALVKATEGTGYVNPCFGHEYGGAKSVGMYAAAYAFARPDTGDAPAVQQADYLLQHAQVAQDGKTLPLMLDLEWPDSPNLSACWNLSPSAMASWVRAFVNEIKAKTGKPMIIYASKSWWDQCLAGSVGSFNDQWLDVASWGVSTPTLPSGWSAWTFWQWTDSALVPGIEHGTAGVDADVFNGSAAQLAALAAPITAGPSARPVVVNPSTGVLAVFYRGSDGNLWWIRYVPSVGWLQPANLGDGPLGSDPTVAPQPNGNYDVFWAGIDGYLWHAWSPNGSSWSVQNMGGSVSGRPVATADGNGGVDVLWRGGDGALWARHFLPSTSWQAAARVPQAGQLCSDPAAVENGAGELDVFWRGCTSDSGLYTLRRGSATASWPSAVKVGSWVGGVPTAAFAAGANIDVFYRALDNSLWHNYRVNGVWHAATKLGAGPLGSDPSLSANQSGYEDVFWRGSSGGLAHAYLRGGWNFGSVPGTSLTQPSVVVQGSGAVDVVFNDQNHSAGHDYYISTWHGPGTLGGHLG